ncbi:SDR family oxidoreductase [Leifsonia kafniensis]|uniref:SDR family oxidoreductase n=1 Tax=Leifsonia kafniensis TaxID=475957 RepID=A0ABP7KQ98_9MICO
MKLEGKVAFITGAASGIGLATAKLFAAEGASVVGVDLSADALAREFDLIPGSLGIALDIANSAEVDAAFVKLDKAFGRLDIVINAAGINAPNRAANEALIEANVASFHAARSGESFDPNFIGSTTDDDFRRVLEVNLFGQFYVIRAATPLLKRGGVGGAIVNISSAAALVGVPMPLYYPASKAGVLGMTRGAAAELAPFNIRVNAIAPAGVDTPLLRQQPEDFNEALISMQPLRRAAQPAEIAETLLFLSSDSGSFYTGQTLEPNGGIHM